MSVPMKSHLSPACTISTASARSITSRLRGRRGEREGEIRGKGERRKERVKGEGERREREREGERRERKRVNLYLCVLKVLC